MSDVPASAYPTPSREPQVETPITTTPFLTVAPLRCPPPCGKLLAEQITIPYRVTCPRCKTVSSAQLP